MDQPEKNQGKKKNTTRSPHTASPGISACFAFCVVFVWRVPVRPWRGTALSFWVRGEGRRLESQPKDDHRMGPPRTHRRAGSGLPLSASSTFASRVFVVNIQTSLISFFLFFFFFFGLTVTMAAVWCATCHCPHLWARKRPKRHSGISRYPPLAA
ncbi:hypothetical protein CGRA01v4_09051 [Colletotrichum graminicola]|nr:hypothetical protein CGRA01v4_09051 [Colletotrichum graminicola]